MITKEKDILYNGVNEEKIKTAKPVIDEEWAKELYKFIVERYNVRLKKDVQGLPKPWTKYKPLLENKFTNVRREHDRESRWLIKNICENDSISYDNKILNCILFRLYNKSSTMELLGNYLDFIDGDFSENNLKNLNSLLEEANKTELIYTNAFFVSGLIRGLKWFYNGVNEKINPVRAVYYFYKEQNVLESIKEAKDQKEVYNILLNCHGLGPFLSYQIFVDFTYIKEFPFSENEFTIAGPGCKKGLNIIFKDFDGLNFEEALFWLRDNQYNIFKDLNYNPKELFHDLPEEDRYINLMSWENLMCESSKLYRILNGGRGKNKYNGYQVEETTWLN